MNLLLLIHLRTKSFSSYEKVMAHNFFVLLAQVFDNDESRKALGYEMNNLVVEGFSRLRTPLCVNYEYFIFPFGKERYRA